MRKHVSTITTVLVFLAGLSLLLYPTVSNYWNSKHQTQAVAEYSDRIEKMDEQEKKQAFEQAEKYNETLISDPGRFTPTEEQDEWYKSLLDIDGTGMMGYITIPEIDCKLALYHTVDASVLQVGVGHMEKGPACRLEAVERTVFSPGTGDFRVQSFLRILTGCRRVIFFCFIFMIRCLHMKSTRFIS